MNIPELIDARPDPRQEGKVKHKLSSIIFVTLCGILSNCESWSDISAYCEIKYEWLSQYVDLSNGVPSEWTFRRTLTILEPDYIESLLREHARLIISKSGKETKQVAVDGKSLRGSRNRELQCIQSISAWCSENSLVLAEEKIEEKSNEIAAIPFLLERLHLKGKTVSIDAAGCQKAIAKKIIDKKGDYVLSLKSNHPKLYSRVKLMIQSNDRINKEKLYDEFDEGHGRLTRRRCFGYEASKVGIMQEWWEGIKSVISVETISSKNNTEVNSGWRYYLSSHEYNNIEVASFIRNHWGIENKLHWILDVNMKEDSDRKAERSSARSFALLKRIALNILRSKPDTFKKKSSMRGRLKKAGWDNNYLLELLS